MINNIEILNKYAAINICVTEDCMGVLYYEWTTAIMN